MNVIEVVFNRDLQPEGVFDTGQPQGVLFELSSPDGSLSRRHGELEVKANLARFIAGTRTVGRRRATTGSPCSGTKHPPTGPAFLAADDGSPLDGDFDGQAGGNLVLMVKV